LHPVLALHLDEQGRQRPGRGLPGSLPDPVRSAVHHHGASPLSVPVRARSPRTSADTDAPAGVRVPVRSGGVQNSGRDLCADRRATHPFRPDKLPLPAKIREGPLVKLLITGITTQSSMAYAVAEEAMKQGHEVILSNPPGRQLSILRRIARRLPAEPVDVLGLDVTDPAQITAAAEAVAGHWDHVDGLLHSIAYA